MIINLIGRILLRIGALCAAVAGLIHVFRGNELLGVGYLCLSMLAAIRSEMPRSRP